MVPLQLAEHLHHLLPQALVDGVHLLWSVQLNTKHEGSCLGHIEILADVGHGDRHLAGGGIRETCMVV